jgi:hypothetical protein
VTYTDEPDIHDLLTPRGVNVNVVFFPIHAGFVGGGAANVSPATAQLILQAVTVMLKGDFPESKIGLGSDVGEVVWNFNVAGSIAYCHAAVASNSRSTARGSCEFLVSTV